MKGRVYSIDILRGLCAFAVLIYHYSYWSGARSPALSFVGIYAVEIFFVISGLSLKIAYDQTDFSKRSELRPFFIKRAFRIFPLLFFATLLTKNLDPLELLATFTVVPIIVDPSQAAVVGGWSLGVEFGCYLLFPLLMLYRPLVPLAIAGTLLYPFLFLSGGGAADQWPAYVNLFNHLGFFAAGMLLADRKAPLAILAVSFPLLLLSPDLITGLTRIAAFVFCVALVSAVAQIRIDKNRLTKPAIFLGDISFGVYLLHPIVYQYVRGPIAVILTLVFASIVYFYFERTFMKIGSQFAAKRIAAS